MKEQQRAPLWDALIAYRKQDPARFHVPGHKGGAGADLEARELLGGVLSIDLTEITGMDDLHQPEGVIAEAERLAAECYGAGRTHFLVGGSTAGNLALILSVCKPGDLLLVQRDAHKSVINGLMLAGARAAFIAPRVDPASGLACGLRAEDVEAALARYPEAVGLLLTDPNYYGIGTPLRPLVDAAHRRGIPVLVDAAHGAHYGFHPSLPDSALAAGADGVVHSTHKMLTAMTMGAMLHLQGSRISRPAVARALSTIQSSSPSYPIMASLDLARRQLHTHGSALFEPALAAAARLRGRLAAIPWLRVVTPPPGATHDPLKLTLGDARHGLSALGGFALMAELERRGCYAEMADPHYVTLALGVSTTDQEADRLAEALMSISSETSLNRQELPESIPNIYTSAYPDISEPVAFRYANCDGRHAETANVPVAEAVGYPSEALVVPYPPGVPAVYPGERITREAASALERWIAAGSRIHGLRPDGTITIRMNGDLS